MNAAAWHARSVYVTMDVNAQYVAQSYRMLMEKSLMDTYMFIISGNWLRSILNIELIL